MKTRFVLLTAAAVLGLASCNKDRVVEMSVPDSINFNASLGFATKATSKTSFATGDKFDVWSVFDNAGAKTTYFHDNYLFDGTSWHSTSTPYYWPETVDGTHTLTFHAVWPENIARTTSADSFNYTVVDASANQKDVLYAKHVSTSKETTGVKLNFRHTLSMIDVKVKNSSSTLKFDVTGIKVAFVNKAGTFTATSVASGNTDDMNTGNLARTDWVATDGTADASKGYNQTGLTASIAAGASAAGLGTSWMLMPQEQTIAGAYTSSELAAPANGAYLAVKMTIRNAADGTVIASERWCCWPVAISWTPGYKYTYTIDLAGGGYEETNVDGDPELDPVLGGQEIIFVGCTVDAWDEFNKDIVM